MTARARAQRAADQLALAQDHITGSQLALQAAEDARASAERAAQSAALQLAAGYDAATGQGTIGADYITAFAQDGYRSHMVDVAKIRALSAIAITLQAIGWAAVTEGLGE